MAPEYIMSNVSNVINELVEQSINEILGQVETLRINEDITNDSGLSSTPESLQHMLDEAMGKSEEKTPDRLFDHECGGNEETKSETKGHQEMHSETSESQNKVIDTQGGSTQADKQVDDQACAGDEPKPSTERNVPSHPHPRSSALKAGKKSRAEQSPSRWNTPHDAQFITIASSRRPESMPRKTLANILNDVQDSENVNIETNEQECGNLDIVVRGRRRDVDRVINELLVKLSVADRIPIPSNLSDELLRLHMDQFRKLEHSLDCRLLLMFGDRSVKVHCCNDQGAQVAVVRVTDFFESLANDILDRVTVPRIYHPWVRGAFGKNLDFIRSETNTLIRLPSSDQAPEEIIVSGLRENVNKALALIHQSYKEVLANMKCATFDLTQAQYCILRENSQNSIDRIMDKCGVSVEIAMLCTPSTHVVLRGVSNSSIGEALSIINSLKSVVSERVAVPIILRSLIKSKLPIFKGNFPTVAIDLAHDGMIVSGSPGNVARMKDHLDSTIEQLLRCFTKETIQLDSQQQDIVYRDFNKKCRQYLNEHNVIVARTSNSDVLSVEGQTEGIKAVREDIMRLCDKAKSEVSKTVSIGSEYHGRLIGPRGSNISNIKKKYDVTIRIPSAEEQSNDIVVHGSLENVDKCIESITNYVDEIKKTERIENITAPKSFHRLIIGYRGSKVKEIRQVSNASVDIPEHNDPSEIIRIRGSSTEVEEASRMIKNILDSFTEEEVELPLAAYFYLRQNSSFWNELRRSFSQVHINERKHGKNDIPYQLTLRGYRNDVERCIKFIESEKSRAMKHYTVEEFPITKLQQSFIDNNCEGMLRNISKNLNVIIEHSKSSTDPETPVYVVYGKYNDVKEATTRMQQTLDKLGDICERKVKIPIALHDRFRRRDELLLRQLRKGFFVEIIVPSRVSMDENFVIRGGEEAIHNVERRLEELVEQISEEMTMEVPCEFVPYLRNNLKTIITPIESKCNVCVEFPHSRRHGDDAHAIDSMVDNIIIIHGIEENCKMAALMIQDSAPIESSIDVPKQYHSHIIGRRGRELMHIKQISDVTDIIVPDRDNPTSSILIRGSAGAVKRARELIAQKVSESSIGSSRYSRNRMPSNMVTLYVDVPKHLHPRIVGRGGIVINRIRGEFGVEIILPGINSPESDITVSVCGLEENCKAAINEILNVTSQERIMLPRGDQRDRRNYDEPQTRSSQRDGSLKVTKQTLIDANAVPRLIGKKGWNIKRFREQYNVEVDFNTDQRNPDVVVVRGSNEDSVNAAIDALKEQSMDAPPHNGPDHMGEGMRDSFMDTQHMLMRDHREQRRQGRAQQPPDTSDLNEFPLF